MSRGTRGEEDDAAEQEVEAKTSFGSLRAKGYRLNEIVGAVLLTAILVVLYYQHDTSKALASAVSRQAIATRYMACMLALPVEDRWNELKTGGICDRISRDTSSLPQSLRDDKFINMVSFWIGKARGERKE